MPRARAKFDLVRGISTAKSTITSRNEYTEKIRKTRENLKMVIVQGYFRFFECKEHPRSRLTDQAPVDLSQHHKLRRIILQYTPKKTVFLNADKSDRDSLGSEKLIGRRRSRRYLSANVYPRLNPINRM
ncbi:hypothetical protein BofuT4_P048740.1 [Botrytis cinerea T4]|uniref:Uncharacterized protein n=1 Tax=Botryotinia fuckeliana (strain T4) TaxID=999810 RepID=G2XZG9_BOTF4|nr:hypothetical protein BofuT4_P048740.1 [Botrytis cinerea T4]